MQGVPAHSWFQALRKRDGDLIDLLETGVQGFFGGKMKGYPESCGAR